MLMVEGTRDGRPPGGGEPSYDSRRRKPQRDPRGDQIWHRIKDDAVAMGLDARAGTQLSRLGLRGELTNGQVEAGFLVRRIYGQYERWHGRRRAPPTPGYIRSIPPSGDEDPKDRPSDEGPEDRDAREIRQIERAEKQMRRLEKCISVLPPANAARCRTLLEALCVDNEPIPDAGLDDVAKMLEYIGRCFNISPGAPLPPPSAVRPRMSPRTAARRVAAHRNHLDKEAWFKVQAKLHPGLDAAGLQKTWDTYLDLRLALKDRDRFRREKAKPPFSV